MVDYRGISTITNKFIYWKWNGKLLPGSTKNFWNEVKPETVGAYTTLKDRHRVKIYVKDIVSVQIKHETKTGHLSEVGSYYDGFYINAHPAHILLGHKIRKLSDYCGRYSNNCIVVGNSVKGIK